MKMDFVIMQKGEPMADLIDRQAAIDFIDAGHLCNPNEPRWSDNEVVNFLKSRPSAQPYTEDSLHRLSADAHLLAGNYEQETAKMLIKAFKNAEPWRGAKS